MFKIVTLLLLVVLLMGCATVEELLAPSEEVDSVAFVYVGPQMDMGWSYAHDLGRQELENEYPDIETTFVELVPEGPESSRVLRDLAEKGNDLIFATSFGYMDSVIEVAGEYPDTLFEHATGYRTANNVGIYDGRGYQGWYLSGIVAGSMTETDTLGYIAPFPIPEVVRNLNAFTLGAQSVNPDVEVKTVWIFDWFNPPVEREAAEALAGAGADVIARESDSTEADEMAQEKGIYVIGYNTDATRDLAPDAFLTAPIWNWGVVYTSIVDDINNDSWSNEPIWWGMAEGVLELAPIADFVPQDVQSLVLDKENDIKDGSFGAFEGPIYDNEGNERVQEGETMPDGDLLAFDLLVDGIVGSIP